MRLSAKATYRVLNKSIEVNPKKGVYYLFKIISFVKSTKYQIREVFLVKALNVDLHPVCSTVCSIINC